MVAEVIYQLTKSQTGFFIKIYKILTMKYSNKVQTKKYTTKYWRQLLFYDFVTKINHYDVTSTKVKRIKVRTKV